MKHTFAGSLCQHQEIMMLSRNWNSIGAESAVLARRTLGAEYDAFIRCCEEIDLVDRDLNPLIEEALEGTGSLDSRVMLSLLASALVSAAYRTAREANYASAHRLAYWALKLEPNHVPAIICLRRIAEAGGDTAGAIAYEHALEMIAQKLGLASAEHAQDSQLGQATPS